MIKAKLFEQPPYSYDVFDLVAKFGFSYSYKLVEVQTNGKQNSFGPYNVQIGDPATYNQWANIYGTNLLINLDYDSDGKTNYEEYISKTNPLKPDSTLRINKMPVIEPQMLELNWESVGGIYYKISYCTNLINSEFYAFADHIISTPPQNKYVIFTDQFKQNNMFFKISVQQ
jgi:hypothetical protein